MKKIVLFVILLLVAGCSAVDITAYRENEPRLDLFEYFEGTTKGWGIVQDRKGALLRQFVVDIEGKTTEAGALVLHEDFNWSDGERSTRTWTLHRENQHELTGTAEDVVGNAAGTGYGNVVNWRYRLNLEVDDRIWKITFDDWLFRVSEGLLINRATMSKFGFTVGEVTIVFSKPGIEGGVQ